MWIEITERGELPINYEEVLVCNKNEKWIAIGRLEKKEPWMTDESWFTTVNSYSPTSPTHWKELPKLP